MRPVPRPQVRPDHAEGVLPALRLLQQHQRGRAESLLGHAESDGHARGRRDAGEARPRCGAEAQRLEQDIDALGTQRRFDGMAATAAARRPPRSADPGTGEHLPLDGSRPGTRYQAEGKRRSGRSASNTCPSPISRTAPGARLGGDKDRAPATRAWTSRPGAAAARRQRNRGRPTARRSSIATSRSRSPLVPHRPRARGAARHAIGGLSTETAATTILLEATARSPPRCTTCSRTTRSRSHHRPARPGQLASSRADLRRVEPRCADCICSSTASPPTTRAVVDNLQRSLINSGIEEGRCRGRRRCASAAGGQGIAARRHRRRLPRLRPAVELEVPRWRAPRTPIGPAAPPESAHDAERAGCASTTCAWRRSLPAPQSAHRRFAARRTDPDRAAQRDGDARAADAAPDVRPRPRRLRRADGAGHSRHAEGNRLLPGELPRNRLGLARWLVPRPIR